jgi:hypothetical protein
MKCRFNQDYRLCAQWALFCPAAPSALRGFGRVTTSAPNKSRAIRKVMSSHVPNDMLAVVPLDRLKRDTSS